MSFIVFRFKDIDQTKSQYIEKMVIISSKSKTSLTVHKRYQL